MNRESDNLRAPARWAFMGQVNAEIVFLWSLVAVVAIQAIYSSSDWGMGWAFLGAMTLIVQRKSVLHVVLVLELPIFMAIFGYSATTLYLTCTEQTYDLVHDLTAQSAAWVALGGTACFLGGLMSVLMRPHHPLVALQKTIHLTEKQCLSIYLMGLFSNEVLLRVAPMSVRVIVYVFGMCAPIGLFMLLSLYTESRVKWIGTWKFYLWLAALVEWSLRSVLGGIFGSTLLFLLIFLSQYIRKSFLVLVIIILMGAVVAPLMQDTKSEYRQKVAIGAEASQRTLKDVARENFQKVFIKGDRQTYMDGIVSLAKRLCIFDIWLSVKRHMDTCRDFAKGRTVVDALITGFIPRILWSDKPITGGVNDLAERYGDMIIAEGTSVSVGAISELYINGGTPAVLCGMFGLGWLAAFILKRGAEDIVQPLGSLMSLAAFSSFIRPEVNLSDLLGGVIRMIFLWWVVRFWVMRHARQHTRVVFRGTGPS